MDGKMKKIVMRFSTSSRMSWLQVWKQMHLWLSLPISTCWWWEVTSARGREKKVLKEQSLSWKKKLRSNDFYSTESWRNGIWTLRRDTPWHSQDTSGTKLKIWEKKKGQSGGINQKCEPHERNPCASGFEDNTWGNLTTSRLWQQSSVEFGEKMHMLSKRDLSSDEMDTSRRSNKTL